MSISKFSLFVSPDPIAKKPTLRQYLKEVGKRKLAGMYPVQVIWLPNRYSNITLETERFRVRVSEDNPAFTVLRELIEEATENEVCLAIVVDEDKSGNWELAEVPGSVSYWTQLGESGYKATTEAKK